MSGAAASALEAVLEGWCAKSRCHNCSEEIVISQCQVEENDAQSFYAIIPKIMPSPNKFNRDVAHCVSANQMCRQPLSVDHLYCQQKYSSHTCFSSSSTEQRGCVWPNVFDVNNL